MSTNCMQSFQENLHYNNFNHIYRFQLLQLVEQFQLEEDTVVLLNIQLLVQLRNCFQFLDKVQQSKILHINAKNLK